MKKPLRILAIDFGMKRIGLAVSDEKQRIAFPYEQLVAGKTGKETLEKLVSAITKGEVERGCIFEKIVLGFPLLLSGKESPFCQEIRFIQERLRIALDREIILLDERFTSTLANRSLLEGGFSRKQRTPHVDLVSATLLLQDFLDANYGPT